MNKVSLIQIIDLMFIKRIVIWAILAMMLIIRDASFMS